MNLQSPISNLYSMAQANLNSPFWVNHNHPTPAQKAPVSEVGVLGWLRANLFSSIGNSLLTALTAIVVYYLVTGMVRWGATAFWEPVWANRKLLAVGSYPSEKMMQPMLVLMAFSLLFGLSGGRWGGLMRNLAIGLGAVLLLWIVAPVGGWIQVRMGIALALLVAGYGIGRYAGVGNSLLAYTWIAFIPFSLAVLHGGISLFGTDWYPAGPPVATSNYGGILLTSLLTVMGIAMSFPIGVALALGRRSSLPVIRYFCIGYIEIIRGVPFITLLFFAAVMLPYFLPAGISNPANLTRAVVATTLFSAAYLAETIRGGLQALPKGQFEAADALGLNHWQKLRIIVLPQALRAVIPDLVGQFIGLFKDTSLVSLVGLTDFLQAARAILVQPAWTSVSGGITSEVYIAVAAVYLIFSFGMSWASRRIERDLGVGKR